MIISGFCTAFFDEDVIRNDAARLFYRSLWRLAELSREGLTLLLTQSETPKRTERKQDQELFDELFERARLHVQAAVQAANPDPMESIFISVLIEMLKAEKRMQARVDELELTVYG